MGRTNFTSTYQCLNDASCNLARPEKEECFHSVENQRACRDMPGLLPTFLFTYFKIETANELSGLAHRLVFDLSGTFKNCRSSADTLIGENSLDQDPTFT